MSDATDVQWSPSERLGKPFYERPALPLAFGEGAVEFGLDIWSRRVMSGERIAANYQPEFDALRNSMLNDIFMALHEKSKDKRAWCRVGRCIDCVSFNTSMCPRNGEAYEFDFCSRFIVKEADDE